MHKYMIGTTLLIVATLSACASTEQSVTTKRVIGLIPTDRVSNLPVLHVPPEIHANQPFTITVTTHGSSSCTTVDGADVQVTDLTALVTPYDRLPAGNDVACTADLAQHPRDIQLTFLSAGQATIRVIGQNFDGERTTNEQIITVAP